VRIAITAIIVVTITIFMIKINTHLTI